MSPFLEQAIVAAIIMGAVGYFIARFVRRRRAGKSCATGCGCGVAGKPFSAGQK